MSQKWGRRRSDNRAYKKSPIPIRSREFELSEPPTKVMGVYNKFDPPHEDPAATPAIGDRVIRVKDVSKKISDMNLPFSVYMIGGLPRRGWTQHDIDLIVETDLPYQQSRVFLDQLETKLRNTFHVGTDIYVSGPDGYYAYSYGTRLEQTKEYHEKLKNRHIAEKSFLQTTKQHMETHREA